METNNAIGLDTYKLIDDMWHEPPVEVIDSEAFNKALDEDLITIDFLKEEIIMANCRLGSKYVNSINDFLSTKLVAIKQGDFSGLELFEQMIQEYNIPSE